VCFEGMKRKAFLLGFYSIGGQVLLLRELVSSLNGDELFIGTALFGWLVSVAAGAYLGGTTRLGVRSTALFIAGVFVLPIVIVVARLSPLTVSNVVGEIIPFSTAALISIVMMLPPGIVSGWLFASITREGRAPAASIVQVYLFEGIGAFVGGVLITILAGGIVSTLEMAVLLGAVVIVGILPAYRKRKALLTLFAAISILAFSLVAQRTVSRFDCYIDGVKYESYRVEKSFDTHYAHQAVLWRDGSLILLTDNTVEAAYPDLLTAENLLIPPLLYKPDARKILFIGRAEFGIMQLADHLPGLSITALDPRRALSSKIDDVILTSNGVERIDNDPMAFFTRRQATDKYDIIIMNTGGLDSYKNSRLLTKRFLTMIKSSLTPGGLVYLPTRYDTDRYITAEQRALLSIIYNVLRESFNHVALWPGSMTLLFASDAPVLDIPYDSIINRLTNLEYAPQFISENYLYDRLDEFRMERLREAVSYSDQVNSLDRPLIPYYQVIYRAKTTTFDRHVVSFILSRPAWTVGIPLLIFLFFVLAGVGKQKKKRYGLFLYLTAGLVSLALELISFYVYQSSAGSLYAEMAALIGAFMLGLAFGTYYSVRVGRGRLEYPALLMLLAATVLFLATYDHINPQVLLFYHVCFLFVVAAATGSLFVAATNRYYPTGSETNRGAGYACELIGSSFGALFSTTILLPVIGLWWLLVALAALIVLAFVGSFLTARGA